jgi:hypothetical protein
VHKNPSWRKFASLKRVTEFLTQSWRWDKGHICGLPLPGKLLQALTPVIGKLHHQVWGTGPCEAQSHRGWALKETWRFSRSDFPSYKGGPERLSALTQVAKQGELLPTALKIPLFAFLSAFFMLGLTGRCVRGRSGLHKSEFYSPPSLQPRNLLLCFRSLSFSQ